MGRADRREIIAEIEKLRRSRVLCYVTSDRQPIGGAISEDALRPIYRHLRDIGRTERIDLFLYSRGGQLDVPWRIVSNLRRAADTWEVLVPLRASSSATLVCLGADQIVFGAQGELGPIDPHWVWKRMVQPPVPGAPPLQVPDTISIEDVLLYARFAREHWGLHGEESLASAFGKLADRIDAVQLGSIYRSKLHIHDTAREVLLSRRSPPDEATLQRIVETLSQEVHAHNHAIPLEAARALGLPAVAAEPALEALMWRLFEDFEDEMKLLAPLDPAVAVALRDVYEEEVITAAVEGVNAADHLTGRIEVRAKRNLPPGLTVNVTVNVPAVEGIDPTQNKAAWMELLTQVRVTAVQSAVQAAQATVSGYGVVASESSLRAPLWVRKP